MNAKKLSLCLKTLLLSALISGIFVSCNYIVDGDDTSYSFRPDVKALDGDSSGIGITSRYRSDKTDFIYFFRMELPGGDSTAQPVIENIGIINQKALKNSNTFLFQDQFVTPDVKYKYRTVFHDSETNEYFTSNWSNEITATTGKGPVVYNPSTAPTAISYDSIQSTLTPNKNINDMKFSAPYEEMSDYIPTLIVKNSVCSRYFPLTDDLTKELIYINLRDIVSDDFLNTPLEIQDIVGMKIEYEEDKKANTKMVKMIYFSSKFNIKDLIKMPDDVEQIKVSTFQGTGIYLPE